ncbi:hypothetical protein [Leptospira broomii]|nr:hypothetical protein [Leptospira broomii]
MMTIIRLIKSYLAPEILVTKSFSLAKICKFSYPARRTKERSFNSISLPIRGHRGKVDGVTLFRKHWKGANIFHYGIPVGAQTEFSIYTT